MTAPIDSEAFGRRVRELREELGWSQGRLGKAAGFSQSNIGWIEQGKSKDPRKQAIALSDALGSSPEWLLQGTGARQTGIRPLTAEQFSAIYEELPLQVRLFLTQAAKDATAKPPAKKRSQR